MWRELVKLLVTGRTGEPTVNRSFPAQADLVFSLPNLASAESELSTLLCLIKHDPLGLAKSDDLAGRVDLAEDSRFETQRCSRVESYSRGSFVHSDADLCRAGESQVLQIGADDQVIVRGAVVVQTFLSDTADGVMSRR